MRSTTKSLGVLLVVTLLACTSTVPSGPTGQQAPDSQPTTPTQVTVPPPRIPAVGWAGLDVLVLDSVGRRIAGAEITLLSGTQAGLSVRTDEEGKVSIEGTFAPTTQVRLSSEGFISAEFLASFRPAPTSGGRVRGEATFRVFGPDPHLLEAGTYRMTFGVDDPPPGIPAELTATVAIGAYERFDGNGEQGYTVSWAGGTVRLYVAGGKVSLLSDPDDPVRVPVAPAGYVILKGTMTATASDGKPLVFGGTSEYCGADMGCVKSTIEYDSGAAGYVELRSGRLIIAKP